MAIGLATAGRLYSQRVLRAREKALSLARANNVANYLWTQAIGARFIAAHGQGSDKPIVSRCLQGDHSLNARVEITFRPILV